MMQNTCEKCRKNGEKLFLKGDRCLSPKCAVTRMGATTTNRGGRRSKKSEYGLQLNEKQKAKAEYGLREKQFKLYFEKAAKSTGATGEMLLQNLEKRLDNVLYRAGWAKSRAQARQIVNHAHMKVNDNVVDIPSYQLKVNDTIEPANMDLINRVADEKPNVPGWLKVDQKKRNIKIVNLPQREEIDTPIDEQLIVEFYSR